MRTSLKTKLHLAARAARLHRPSPLGVVAKGLLAGAAGAAAQSAFFALTKNVAPKTPAIPPERGGKPDGHDESSLQTVARRAVEGLALRGPLDGERKAQLGSAIHYAFGAGWGALYALLRESTVHVPPPAFGLAVWMASDNGILPAFRLAAPATRYPLAVHRYAIQAHVVYGVATAGAYHLLRELGVTPLSAIPALLGLRALSFLRRTPPGRIAARKRPFVMRWFSQRADRAFAH
jgi:hypothetical protein